MREASTHFVITCLPHLVPDFPESYNHTLSFQDQIFMSAGVIIDFSSSTTRPQVRMVLSHGSKSLVFLELKENLFRYQRLMQRFMQLGSTVSAQLLFLWRVISWYVHNCRALTVVVFYLTRAFIYSFSGAANSNSISLQSERLVIFSYHRVYIKRCNSFLYKSCSIMPGRSLICFLEQFKDNILHACPCLKVGNLGD